MQRGALASEGRYAKGRGALQHLKIGYLPEIEDTEIDGLPMADHKILHYFFSYRLQLAEMNGYSGKLEELSSQTIVRGALGLLYVTQFFERIENAMNGCSRKR